MRAKGFSVEVVRSDSNPSFDAQPGMDAVWLRLRSRSGATASGIAVRHYQGPPLVWWHATRRLWTPVDECLRDGPIELLDLTPEFANPRRFFQTDGLVTFEEFQGRGAVS